MSSSTDFDFPFLLQIIHTTTNIYLTLEASVGAPPTMNSKVKSFRHGVKDDRLLVFLKGVRYVSLLNASIALLVNGFYSEIGILARCMDEALEDATFFTILQGKDGELSDRQLMALKEFYQEEFEDFSVGMLRSSKRHRVPRDKIRAAIAALPYNEVNAHDTAHIHGTVRDTFSGYVHGAYPHIMELYGATVGYHTRGMEGTRRQAEAESMFVTYVYRWILMGQCAAIKLARHDVWQQLLEARNELEMRWRHLAKDPKESLAALKRKNVTAPSGRRCRA